MSYLECRWNIPLISQDLEFSKIKMQCRLKKAKWLIRKWPRLVENKNAYSEMIWSYNHCATIYCIHLLIMFIVGQTMAMSYYYLFPVYYCPHHACNMMYCPEVCATLVLVMGSVMGIFLSHNGFFVMPNRGDFLYGVQDIRICK